jgi:hypothetical protein
VPPDSETDETVDIDPQYHGTNEPNNSSVSIENRENWGEQDATFETLVKQVIDEDATKFE